MPYKLVFDHDFHLCDVLEVVAEALQEFGIKFTVEDDEGSEEVVCYLEWDLESEEESDVV